MGRTDGASVLKVHDSISIDQEAMSLVQRAFPLFLIVIWIARNRHAHSDHLFPRLNVGIAAPHCSDIRLGYATRPWSYRPSLIVQQRFPGSRTLRLHVTDPLAREIERCE